MIRDCIADDRVMKNSDHSGSSHFGGLNQGDDSVPVLEIQRCRWFIE
jgi:hypothetical protein